MAFDLVHYFTEQIKGLKPALLPEEPQQQRCSTIQRLNCLSLSKLIQVWQQSPEALYTEITEQNPLYAQQLAQQLTPHAEPHIALAPAVLEQTLTRIVSLQLLELKQLDSTAKFGLNGMAELLTGQIEHLSGQAEDWVWQCTGLTQLLGSKAKAPEPEVSLGSTLKEFQQLIQQHDQAVTATADQNHQHAAQNVRQPDTAQPAPTWAIWATPVVAAAILALLYQSYQWVIGA